MGQWKSGGDGTEGREWTVGDRPAQQAGSQGGRKNRHVGRAYVGLMRFLWGGDGG